jgi:hypothetical protein
MSDSCTPTAPFVEAMARQYNAEITLLHALEMPSGLIPDCYGGDVPVIDTTAIWKAETEAAAVLPDGQVPESQGTATRGFPDTLVIHSIRIRWSCSIYRNVLCRRIVAKDADDPVRKVVALEVPLQLPSSAGVSIG